ncbi:MAG: ribokinase [Actinobacteria bacterium]|nr:MAG: ribokinase [Actinomycetota bacterium]
MRLPRVQRSGLRLAAVGHVEWVRFARVAHVPRPGEVVHALEPFHEPAGGGAVAAVQLARLAGSATLLTALGEDGLASRSVDRLRELGVSVCCAPRAERTRMAVSLFEASGERTITTFGPRLEPSAADAELPWGELGAMHGIYFTAGDLEGLRLARAARVLVASPRARAALGHGVRLDALVLSGEDEGELRVAEQVGDEAQLVVWTDGQRGGRFRASDGSIGSYPAAARPAAAVDSYGCGDAFAAGLTYALSAGMELEQALSLAARCGAVCATGRGPYERQLSAADLAQAR